MNALACWSTFNKMFVAAFKAACVRRDEWATLHDRLQAELGGLLRDVLADAVNERAPREDAPGFIEVRCVIDEWLRLNHRRPRPRGGQAGAAGRAR